MPTRSCLAQPPSSPTRETKGCRGEDAGKYVRYHTFSAFDATSPDPTGGAGLDPLSEESAACTLRRSPARSRAERPSHRLGVERGTADAGGPSDIMCRVGRINPNDPMSNGLRPRTSPPMIRTTTRENAVQQHAGDQPQFVDGLSAHPGRLLRGRPRTVG
ncbi:MAG: hypothetical protein R3B67_04315 [Phycisphaerales bacterium]